MSPPQEGVVATATTTTEELRQQIAASEREINTIKAQLRALGPASSSSEEQSSEASANSLTIAWIKV